jgi:hypothetical protein
MAEFKVEGLQEVMEAFRRADRAAQSETKRFFRDWSMYGIREVQRRILNAGAVDTNELIQNIGYKIKETKRTVTSTIKPSPKADKYALYVEEGTEPHFPPIKKLQGWADRHGIPVYAIALKIAREGTEGHHMWQETYEDLEFVIDDELDDLLEAIVRKI